MRIALVLCLAAASLNAGAFHAVTAPLRHPVKTVKALAWPLRHPIKLFK